MESLFIMLELFLPLLDAERNYLSAKLTCLNFFFHLFNCFSLLLLLSPSSLLLLFLGRVLVPHRV